MPSLHFGLEVESPLPEALKLGPGLAQPARNQYGHARSVVVCTASGACFRVEIQRQRRYRLLVPWTWTMLPR